MFLYLLCISMPFHLVKIAVWAFCILLVCDSHLMWRFHPVGGVGQLACQGFLLREACVSVLVCGTGFLLSGVQWSVQ